MQQSHAFAYYICAEAAARLSLHQYTIAGNQVLMWFALHIKSLIVLLHKEISSVVVIVRNRSLEGHRQPLPGLGSGEGAYGVQIGHSAGRSRAGARGPPKDDGERRNQSLHHDDPVKSVLCRWRPRLFICWASRINHFRRGIAESRTAG
jgi:hypothetical protein